MPPLEAHVKRSYYVRVAIIGLFTLGLGALLMLLQYRHWVKLFDDHGVTRRDGKQLLWSHLKNVKFVHMRLRSGREGPLNHVELIFHDGRATVFPLMLENSSEVMAVIGKLPVGRAAVG